MSPGVRRWWGFCRQARCLTQLQGRQTKGRGTRRSGKGLDWKWIHFCYALVLIVLKELTFSLMMFNGKTQRASCFWREPDGPNFWNVHFATYTELVKKQKATRLHSQTFGKTRLRGSSLTLIGSSICDNTSLKRKNLHICLTSGQQPIFKSFWVYWNITYYK